ncbi:MAG: Tfp pilus assembly PilM family ATPase [Myxococcota bacterium]|jgi:Tfp pilus assembly PilM family ATPase
MPRLISVDLGSHAVKVSTWRGGRGSYEHEHRYAQPVPQDGAVAPLEARLAALDALLDDEPTIKASGNDIVAMALPGEFATSHRLTLPFADRAQVEKTLSFAVEAEVPFDMDEMVLAWRIANAGLSTDVVATLVKHEVLSGWIAGLASRGLDPAVVFVDGDAHGHWAQSSSGPVVLDEAEAVDSPLVGIVDVGHAHTVVSVVRDGKVELARTVNVGGLAFTRAIQQSLRCEWPEAEQRKHGEWTGLDDDRTDPGLKRGSGYATLPAVGRHAMDGAIGLLLAEVRSTLIKCEDLFGAEVSEIRLTGGSAAIDELWDYFAEDLGVTVRRVQDPDGEKVPGQFALCHALAMQAANSDGKVADLRVGDLTYRGRGDIARAAVSYGAAGLLFFAVAAVVMFAVQYRSLSAELEATQAAVQDLVAATFPDVPPGIITDGGTAVQLMRDSTEEAVLRAEVLGDRQGGVPPTIDIIYQLHKAFPPPDEITVKVSDLTITPSTVTFNAETDGYAASSAVEEALQKHVRFRTASKGQEQRMANGRVKFPITIALDAEVDEDAEDDGESTDGEEG